MLYTKEEWDGILFFTAKTIAYHQGIFRELNKIYQMDIVRYETLANESPLRHSKMMRPLPLEYEAKTCRMLGLLVASEEDRGIKESIIRQIKLIFSEIYQMIKKPDPHMLNNYLSKIEEMTHNKNTSTYGLGIQSYLLAYLYPDGKFLSLNNIQSKILSELYTYEKKLVMERLSDLPTETNYSTPINVQATDSDFKIQNLIKSWLNVIDFVRLRSLAMDEYINRRNKVSSWKNKMFSDVVAQLSWEQIIMAAGIAAPFPIKQCILDPTMQPYGLLISEAFSSISHISEMADFIIEDLISPEKLTKKELENIILFSATASKNNDNFEFDVMKYVYNIFIFRLLQEYKKAKELYFQDNEEYRLLEEKQKQTEILVLQNQLQELIQKNNRLIEENQSLQEENQRLRALLLKTEQETQKNYKQQISDLDQQIKDQQKKLYDLVPLREFIFSLENIEHFSENSISLQDYSKAARIAVLGGHENLRKKIKQNYPEFLVMDGTLKSLDFFALLQNIDILFLFTEHMSHAVYYNAIAAAERYKVKLIYVRVTNMEIIERNMAEEIKLWIENYNK